VRAVSRVGASLSGTGLMTEQDRFTAAVGKAFGCYVRGNRRALPFDRKAAQPK
jgi:hypothetical protein